jgi:hypothetical protein
LQLAQHNVVHGKDSILGSSERFVCLTNRRR